MAHNLLNKVFGNLRVVGFYGSVKHRLCWYCLCKCGKQHIVNSNSLLTGTTKSCGCKKGLHKHGMYKDRFYTIWHHILQRCNNPKCDRYDRYGGRGIKCEWESFEEFKRDTYTSYLRHLAKYGDANTTIDRRNNDGNYSKQNCRWATRRTQTRNRNYKK